MREEKYVLGLAGSPRRQANSTILLDEVLKGAIEKGGKVEKIILNDYRIRPCQACGGCTETGECIQNDDMEGLYPKLLTAGIIVLATPVYFYSVSGVAKAFIDRTQALWIRKYRLKKMVPEPDGRGYLIAVGATKGARLFECPVLIARYFFDAINAVYQRGLLVRGIEKAGEILNHGEYLEKARELGRSLLNFNDIVN